MHLENNLTWKLEGIELERCICLLTVLLTLRRSFSQMTAVTVITYRFPGPIRSLLLQLAFKAILFKPNTVPSSF